MNLFATNNDPKIAAFDLDDRRGRKMILESAQILATNLQLRNKFIGYKMTHANHPVTVWARQSRQHIEWLVEYSRYLNECYRSYSNRDHLSLAIVERAYSLRFMFSDAGFQKFVTVAGDYSHLETHEAYRKYLNVKWQNDVKKSEATSKILFYPTWKNRENPEWLDLHNYQYPITVDDMNVFVKGV